MDDGRAKLLVGGEILNYNVPHVKSMQKAIIKGTNQKRKSKVIIIIRRRKDAFLVNLQSFYAYNI